MAQEVLGPMVQQQGPLAACTDHHSGDPIRLPGNQSSWPWRVQDGAASFEAHGFVAREEWNGQGQLMVGSNRARDAN